MLIFTWGCQFWVCGFTSSTILTTLLSLLHRPLTSVATPHILRGFSSFPPQRTHTHTQKRTHTRTHIIKYCSSGQLLLKFTAMTQSTPCMRSSISSAYTLMCTISQPHFNNGSRKARPGWSHLFHRQPCCHLHPSIIITRFLRLWLQIIFLLVSPCPVPTWQVKRVQWNLVGERASGAANKWHLWMAARPNQHWSALIPHCAIWLLTALHF